jgi:Zn-dependent protease
MRWSWSVGRMFGIRIQIHFTFLLFVGWIALAQGLLTGDAERALLSVTLMLLVFACVLLHELGHALTARRFGVQTRDITLLPIGGVARLERMPDKPSEEILVAIAGPAVNVAIAFGLFVFMRVFHLALRDLSVTGTMLESLLYINVVIVLFNLIPAFPMDGGRVLRALLAIRMPYLRATRVASYVGQGVAVVFAIAGIAMNRPMLLFIAMFVFIAAAEERGMVQSRTVMHGLPVRAAMVTEFHVLDAGDTLQQAMDRVLAGGQHDFPVLHDGLPVGILTRSELVAGLRHNGPETRVGEVMRPDQAYVDPGEPLEAVIQRMRERNRSAFPVLSHGQLVGMVTLEHIAELLTMQDAMKRFQGAS